MKSLHEVSSDWECEAPMRIRLDEVHYEMMHRYEVNRGAMRIQPDGYSFEESISAYYENIHGYHIMVTRGIDGKMAFTSDFPRGKGESYASLAEAKDSESYRGFAALVRRMNHYRREALAAFANPAGAKRKTDFFEAFERALRSIGAEETAGRPGE